MFKTLGTIGAAGIAAGFLVGGTRGAKVREVFTLPTLVGLVGFAATGK